MERGQVRTQGEGKPVDLRHNRESDLIFPDGLPPGAIITISNEQESRGKRLRVRFPPSAPAKIVHRKVDKAPEIPTIVDSEPEMLANNL